MTQITEEQSFRRAAVAARPSGSATAWPTLTKAAEMLGLVPSTLSRAVDARGVTKYEAGRRDKKLAPDAVLDLAVVYAVDVNDVAESLMRYAEAAGAEERVVSAVEQTIGAWLAGRARQTTHEDAHVDAIVAAVRELATPEVANAILARAGFTS